MNFGAFILIVLLLILGFWLISPSLFIPFISPLIILSSNSVSSSGLWTLAWIVGGLTFTSGSSTFISTTPGIVPDILISFLSLLSGFLTPSISPVKL